MRRLISYEAKKFMRGFGELVVLALAVYAFLWLGLSF